MRPLEQAILRTRLTEPSRFMRRRVPQYPAGGGGGGGITFVGAGSFEASSGAITPTLPPGTAENDILAFIAHTSWFQAITLSGYVEAGNSPQEEGTYGTRLTVLWKRAGSSESPIATNDSGFINYGQILGFRGCVETGDPFDATSGSSSSSEDTAIVIPGLTTTVPNAYVLAAVGFYRNVTATDNLSGEANGNLAGLAELTDQSSSVGLVKGGFGVIGGTKVFAGATGNTTATAAAAITKNYWSGALIPA